MHYFGGNLLHNIIQSRKVKGHAAQQLIVVNHGYISNKQGNALCWKLSPDYFTEP
jgi:hypothetical protein